MEQCYNGITIPPRIVEACDGDYKSTDCVLTPNAFTYLGLPVNSSQSAINSAIQASLMAKDEIIGEIPVPDGSETKVIASTNVTVTGTGTILDPYSISSEIEAPDGSETKIIAGDNVTVTGTGTTLDPYVVEAIVPTITPVYRALLTQNGLSSPVSNVLENTVGDNLLFSRISEGIYLVQQEDITNPLLTNVVLKQSNVAYVKTDFEGSPVFCFYINKINDYSFSLTVEMNDIPSDNLLGNMYMEFEIYITSKTK